MKRQFSEVFTRRRLPRQAHRRASAALVVAALFFLLLPEVPVAAQNTQTAPDADGKKTGALPGIKEVLPLSVPATGLTGGKPLLQFSNGFGGDPTLLPRAPSAAAFVRQFAGARSAKPFRIEVVAVIPPAAGQAYSAQDVPLMLRKLALIANSIHKLEGLEYWSASRKKMRTLYEESWRIVSPDTQTRVSDPSTLSELGAGPSWSFYTHQKDLTFGSTTSMSTVSMGADSMHMINANVSPVKLLFVQVVAPGALESGIYAMPCREGLLLYGVTFVQATDVAANRVFESARNKAFAIFNWFVQEAADAQIVAKSDLTELVER